MTVELSSRMCQWAYGQDLDTVALLCTFRLQMASPVQDGSARLTDVLALLLYGVSSNFCKPIYVLIMSPHIINIT